MTAIRQHEAGQLLPLEFNERQCYANSPCNSTFQEAGGGGDLRVFAIAALLIGGCADIGKSVPDPPQKEQASTLPPIGDFLCGSTQAVSYDYKTAAQYPPSDASKAWNYLGGTYPNRCWNYSILTVGLIGTESEIAGLVDYVLSPSHQRSPERYMSYLRIPSAVGALVGRGGGSHQAGLNFLFDCSDVAYWSGKIDVIKSAGFDEAQAALNLALSCTEALGLTRSSVAKAKLDAILQDTSAHPDIHSSAQTGLDDRALILLNEPALAPYFLP